MQGRSNTPQHCTHTATYKWRQRNTTVHVATNQIVPPQHLAGLRTTLVQADRRCSYCPCIILHYAIEVVHHEGLRAVARQRSRHAGVQEVHPPPGGPKGDS